MFVIGFSGFEYYAPPELCRTDVQLINDQQDVFQGTQKKETALTFLPGL